MAPKPIDKKLLVELQAQRTLKGSPAYKRPKFISGWTRSKSFGSSSFPLTPLTSKGAKKIGVNLEVVYNEEIILLDASLVNLDTTFSRSKSKGKGKAMETTE
ncbi:unnamed protein product [Ilex paraguariensis]|uniref:Uncharacterized protein n=1 Tax=Ilex paraguariensis TaxID=185542 RepID=A0ABC8TND5_9AQUA